MARAELQDRHARRRRAAQRLAGSLLASWGLASLLTVSFVATAAEGTRMPDHAFRQAAASEPDQAGRPPLMLAALTFRETPPALPPLAEPARPSGLARLAPLIRRVDLERGPSAGALPDNPLLFLADHSVLPPQALRPALVLAKPWRALFDRLSRFDGRSLEPAAGGGSGEAEAGSAVTTGSLLPRPLLAFSRPDGSTPAASRAAALASATPAPAEPEIVAAAAMRLPAFAKSYATGRGYLDLLQPESLASEQRCLAEAVYFEARSESEPGQAAVAQVVLNRVKSGLYPETVCGVVYQNRHRFKACQFTFACEGRSLAIREPLAWEAAERVAKRVLEGETYLPAIGHSTHYHAEYVAPHWSRRLKRMDQIGRHIFYRLHPGQT